MAEPIELRFHFTDRLMASGASRIRRRERWRILRALLNFRTFATLLVLIVIGYAMAPEQSAMPVFGRGAAFGAILGAAALFLAADAQSWTLHRAEATIREARGEAVVTLSAEGARLRQGGELYALDWPAVTEIVEYEGGLMLFTSVFRAVPVPDEALPAGVSRADVLRMIEDWRR